MSFTHDDDAKLCELVSSYPQLYDLSHKDFKDIILKDNIWKEIATSLGKKTGKCLYNILITILLFITSLLLQIIILKFYNIVYSIYMNLK